MLFRFRRKTGASYGDLDEEYLTASYRVLMDEAQAGRVFGYIKHLQATSPLWHAATYNCVAFIQNIARYIGLQVPGNHLLYPEEWVNQLQALNGGGEIARMPLGAAGNSPHERQNKKGRLALVEEAVEKVYKHCGGDEKERERIALGAEYRDRYQSLSVDASKPPFPHFIGVWDTVRALGIPGSSGLVFWRHAFHNATLNPHVPYARQALSIDENRQILAPEIWHESEESAEAKARSL